MRAMTDRARVLVLIMIMAMGFLLVTGTTIGILYHAAFNEEKERLIETAHSQARLIEAVARYDEAHSSGFPGGSGAATLQQIVNAHREYEGFGNTGEFTLARKRATSSYSCSSIGTHRSSTQNPCPSTRTLPNP